MSLNAVMGNAVSGLGATQAALAVVANNIANAGTAGYAREEVDLQPLVAGGQSAGVRASAVKRIADRALEAAAASAGGDLGRATVTSDVLDRLQTFLGAPGSENGLAARLDAVSASAIALASGSDPAASSADFVAKADAALAGMKQFASDIDALSGEVAGNVTTVVDRANTLLARIGSLNDTISGLQARGGSAALGDERAAAVSELGTLIGIRSRETPDGRIAIDTVSGATLVDRLPRKLSGDASVRIVSVDPASGKQTPGATLDAATAGGQLGGLLELRDRTLPGAADRLGALFAQVTTTLNGVHNEHSAVPAPARLDGRNTGLTASDRLGFSGAATFAVADAAGTMLASTRIDFDALPASATVGDLVSAINSGLGGKATASFAGGRLTLTATDPRNGIAVAGDAAKPAARAGAGLSAFFGLNDLVSGGPALPSGLMAGDAHGFNADGTIQLAVRDSAGRIVASDSIAVAGTATVGDLVGRLNASTLGKTGAFALDPAGSLTFSPVAGQSGASLATVADSSARGDTGLSFSAMFGITAGQPATARTGGGIRADIAANPSKLAVAVLATDAAIGAAALGTGDARGATALADALSGPGGVAIERAAASLVRDTATAASRASDAKASATARSDEANRQRDSVSGVNVDEELAHMIQLQNSYAASARVLSAARDMYDVLLGMMR